LADDHNWGGMLKKIKTEMEKRHASKTAAWMAEEEFYKGAYATLVAVKDAWRNTTMHVDKQYDSERAEDIYRAVRRFMETVFSVLS
jgi:hypothetical protein